MRKKFGLGSIVTKAAAKAAEKIKKIDKKDMATFSGVYKKQMKALKELNKPAVDEYNKKVAQIKSRITEGKSKADLGDLQSAYDKLQNKLIKKSKDIIKKYEGLPDIRSRFRPEPGPKRKLVKDVKNPMKRAEILYKDRLERFKKESLPESGMEKKYKKKKFRGN